MASEKFKALVEAENEHDLKMDMSPMIDMVFLLLIFFLVASTIIKLEIDPNVKPAIAENAKTQDDIRGRVVINIYKDGTIYGPRGNKFPELSTDDVTELCKREKEENDQLGRKTRLHLRADREAPVLLIKKVSKAAGAAGVQDVIFSTYQD